MNVAAKLSGVPKVSTKEAILQTSIDLFNSEGFENTSIATICEHVGIMAGNLTYYFPKKRDIVLTIAERFDAELSGLQGGLLAGLLAGEAKVTPEVTHSLLRQTLTILWQYRFFYTSMMSLHHLDERIYNTYRYLDQQARVGLAQLIQKGINDEVICPLQYPNSPSVLAGNLWYLMWSCMFFQKARDRELGPAENLVINNCLMHLGAIIEPLVDPDFIAEYCREVTHRR